MVYKIMLINPPKGGFDENANFRCFPAIAGIQLATRVKNDYGESVDVKVVDGAIISGEDIEKIVSEYKPNLVGLSVLSITYPWALRIAEMANAKIVLGNDHAALLPELILRKREAVHYIITNDVGETPFSDLVGCLLNGNGVEGVDSLVYRGSDGQIIRNSESTYNLSDNNTVPDLTLVENQLDVFSDNYMTTFGHMHSMTVRPIIINNARGCKNYKNKCDYCSILELRLNLGEPTAFWNTVRQYNAQFGINLFYEAYDSFLSSPKYVDRLIETMPNDIKPKIESGEIGFFVYANATDVSKPINIKRLKQLGVVRVNMGLDSGSESALASLKNPVASVDTNIKALNMLKDAGISVHASFMVGARDETKNSLDTTVSFIEQIVDKYHTTADPFFSSIELSRLIPLPNCSIWDTFSERHPQYQEEDVLDVDEITRLWFKGFTKIDHDYAIEELKKVDRFLAEHNIQVGRHV